MADFYALRTPLGLLKILITVSWNEKQCQYALEFPRASKVRRGYKELLRAKSDKVAYGERVPKSLEKERPSHWRLEQNSTQYSTYYVCFSILQGFFLVDVAYRYQQYTLYYSRSIYLQYTVGSLWLEGQHAGRTPSFDTLYLILCMYLHIVHLRHLRSMCMPLFSLTSNFSATFKPLSDERGEKKA